MYFANYAVVFPSSFTKYAHKVVTRLGDREQVLHRESKGRMLLPPVETRSDLLLLQGGRATVGHSVSIRQQRAVPSRKARL